MIKKSRKILTLLLASLLIMSSLGALSVSAATAFDANGNLTLENTKEYVTASTDTADISGDDVVFNTVGGAVTYTISNVPESGMYTISSVILNDAGNSNVVFELALTAGTNTWYDVASYNKWEVPTLWKTLKLGSIYLEKDVPNTFTITLTKNAAALDVKLRDLKIEKVNPIVLSTTGETKIGVTDSLNRDVRRLYDGDETDSYAWNAKSDETTWPRAILNVGGFATFRVSSPVDMFYDVYAMGGPASAAGGYTLYSDDTLVANSVPAVFDTASTVLKTTKLCGVRLTAGTHDLKLVVTGIAAEVGGLKIVPSTPYTLSATATTAIDAASFLGFDVAPATNTSNSYATGVIEGTHTYIGFNDPVQAVYYSVESEAEQKYSVSLVASRIYEQTFRLTNMASEEYIQGTAGATSDNFVTAEFKIGEMTLPAGVSILKFNAVDYNQKFIYEIRFTPVVESTFSAGEAEVVMSGDYEEVSVPINFTGSADVCGFQIDVAYDEDVKYVGYENGDILAGSLAVAQNGVVFANISGSDVAIANGTLATLKFEVPTQAANDFEISVTVAQVMKANGTEPAVEITGDFSAKNGVIKVVSPIKFTNGTTEVNDVVSGTMALEVDLSDASNANKNMVIFAIYSVNDGYAVLEYSESATFAAGKATATITDIDLTSGVDYYAKAFVWNGTSYYGFSQTIGK